MNPGSLILSGAMMLRFLGWSEAADLVEKAMDDVISQKVVTYDFARQMEGARDGSADSKGMSGCSIVKNEKRKTKS